MRTSVVDSRGRVAGTGVREAAYRNHLQDLTLASLRVALWLVIVIITLDGALQFFLDRGLFLEILWMRIGVLLVSGALLGISHRPVAHRFAYPLSLFGALVMAADVEAAIVVSGGYHSSFQTGLSLLLVALGLLFPYGLAEMSLACGLIWLVYLAPTLLHGPSFSLGQSGFWLNAFFLFCGSVIATTASHLTSRLRRQEFFSRLALEDEKQKSENLLLNILPEAIAARLKDGEEPISDSFAEVTVLFADVVGFTPFSEGLAPSRLVEVLNELFSAFDSLSERYGVEKIKTIGDAYMVVGGVPVEKRDHAEAVTRMAIEMVEEVDRFSERLGERLDIRIGINTGPAVAGVIGRKKFTYDLWGDTVNTASRMESHGIAGRIQVTGTTYERLRETFEFVERGEIDVKGKGLMKTYFLRGPRPARESTAGIDETD